MKMRGLPEEYPAIRGFLSSDIREIRPRVRWECAGITATPAEHLSSKPDKAIPGLPRNTSGSGEAVSRIAAFALSETARRDTEAAEILLPFFEKMAAGKTNSGVRNIYISDDAGSSAKTKAGVFS